MIDMPMFKLTMTRTETHSVTDIIGADNVDEAIQLMYEMECDGYYDQLKPATPVPEWEYEHGEVNSVTHIKE